MKNIIRSLTQRPDPVLLVVVAQYHRDSLPVGQEQEFHWAIAVVENLKSAATEESPCYQVHGRTYTTPTPYTEWVIHVNRTAKLGRTDKWRGGVIIGKLKKVELEELDKVR